MINPFQVWSALTLISHYLMSYKMKWLMSKSRMLDSPWFEMCHAWENWAIPCHLAIEHHSVLTVGFSNMSLWHTTLCYRLKKDSVFSLKYAHQPVNYVHWAFIMRKMCKWVLTNERANYIWNIDIYMIVLDGKKIFLRCKMGKNFKCIQATG